MQPMRHSQSRSTRFVTRAPDALIGLVRLLARQAAGEILVSDVGVDRIAREETVPETRPAAFDHRMTLCGRSDE